MAQTGGGHLIAENLLEVVHRRLVLLEAPVDLHSEEVGTAVLHVQKIHER